MPDSPAIIPLNLSFVTAFLLPGADGRAILVDAGMAGTVPRLKRLIGKHGYSPSSISLILLTHAHPDHTGGVPALKAWTQASVALGRLDLETARTGKEPPVQRMTGMMRLMRRLMGQHGVPRLEPDVLIDEEMDLSPYGVAGRALHTPGHSPGSVSIWLDSGDLLVGDLFMGGTLRPARPTFPVIVGDMSQLERSIARILVLQPRCIYASHGGPFTPEIVRRAFPFLAASS